MSGNLSPKGLPRPFASSHPEARRKALLFVESLESRRLLSTGSVGTIVTPAVATSITADFGHHGGGGGGFGGGGSGVTNPNPPSSAYTPSQISQAYSLNASATTGSGQTIAIVDAYNDPNISADLAAFDAKYGLASASLTVVNQSGQSTNLPQTDPNWSLEIALDVEWAHAAAPGAKILLVEANSASTTDLMTAVQTAAKSASVVSMSWGGSEFSGEKAYDTAAYFANPNVTFVAATGDSGGGAEWPASSPYVVSVGGTTLSLSSSGSYGSETAWSASGSWWTGYSGSGGGVSSVESLPSYQASALGTKYATGRATPDVSAVANPNTGLAVYSSVAGAGATGWFQIGGTSAGSPIWAGIVAAADQARASNHLAALSTTQTLSLLYSQYGSTASTASTYSSAFHDITSGSNLVANATKGYDLVTGLGSPVGSALVKAASTYTGVSASGVKASAAVVVATPSQPVTPHAEVIVVTLPSAPVVVIPVSTFLPIAPLVTPAPIAAASASTSSLSSSIATSTTVARALPVQPLTSPSLELRPSSYDEPALVHDWTTDPELLLDPSMPRDWPDLPPLPIEGPAPVLIVHDDAVAELVGEHYSVLAAELASSWDLSVDFESATPGAYPVLSAGAAILAWGLWEFRSRRTDRVRRKWNLDVSRN
jgi:hypothetical protein